MTFPIGSLVGILSLKGAAEFDAGIMGAQRSLNLAGETATKFGASTDRASASSAKLRAAQLSAVAASERYNALLTEGNASTAKLASSEATLIRANERVAASYAQVASAQRSAASESYAFATTAGRGLGGTLDTAKSLGIAFGGIALALKAIDAGKQAIGFERELTQIETNVGGTTDSIDAMKKAILEIAPETGSGLDDLATSLYHIESVGLRGASAYNVLKIAAEGAKVGNADLEETTNALTSTVASGIPGVENMGKAMGQLIAIVGTGDMKMSDLNDALATGGLSILKEYGLSLTDVGAALATFGDNNIRGRDATTKLIQSVQSMSVVAPKGQAQLAALGLGADQLAKDLESGGLPKALHDLKDHLDAANITGDKVGHTLTSIFTKRAGTGLAIMLGQIDRFDTKVGILTDSADTFTSKWDKTKQTVSFALAQLNSSAQVTAVQLAEKATPAAAVLAHMLAEVLPAALHIVEDALKPFAAGWRAVGDVLGPVAHGADDVGHVLEPLAPVLKGTATAVLAMWVAFKGYDIARTAVFAVQDAAARMAANAKSSFGTMRAEIGATSAQLATQSAVMEADLLAVGAAAQEEAATAAEAQLAAMRTYGQVSASEIADMEAVAATARASAVQVAAAAEEAAAAVNAAGDAAKVGWASIGGPVAIAAIGLATLVTAFHHANQGEQELKATTSEFLGVLQQTNGAINDQVVAMVTQKLATGGVYDLARKMGVSLDVATQAALGNKEALREWAKATGTTNSFVDPVERLARGLGDAQSQYKLATSQAKANTTATHDNASAQKTAADALKAVDTNLARVAAGSTAAGNALLGAANSYQSSTQGIADRGALIGATLKAANGDALEFASAMIGTGQAVLALTGAFADQRDQLAQQSQQQTQAAERVNVAQKHLNEVRGNAKHTAYELASAERSLHDAQAAAAKGGALAYADTERAALRFKKTQDGLKASIDANAKGAGDLVSQLQGIQSAAVTAAAAMFQHARQTENGTKAADDAYKVYISKTKQALIDNRKELGLTRAQARALAREYLNTPKHVKTLIESEGTDPILTVLNKIGKLLAHIAHEPWKIKVTADTSQFESSMAKVKALGGNYYYQAPSSGSPQGPIPHRASGGDVIAGRPYIVHDSNKPEIFIPRSSGHIYPDARALMNGTQQKAGTHIDHFTYAPTINYPEPERATVSLPRTMRDAAAQLDSF